MSEEDQALIPSTQKAGISLYRPGSIFNRMTSEIMPFAERQMQADQDTAIPLYEDACSMLSEGRISEAETLLERSAELGLVDAQHLLGELNLLGSQFSKNLEKAAHWFQRAADQGDHRSQIRLGWLHEAGLGFEVDQAKSVYWYRLAAEQGNVDAQFNLAAKYDNGEGVHHNPDEAARWYRLAAEQGHADAQYFLGQAYEAGDGVEQDIQEAIDWYILASEQNHASARRRFWTLCLEGAFYPEEDAEAVFAEKIGASLGYAGAQFKLGFRYDVGDGVEKNLPLAHSWYEKAAQNGFKEAHYHLAIHYQFGRGVPVDEGKAAHLNGLGNEIQTSGSFPDFKRGTTTRITGEGVTSSNTKPDWLFDGLGQMDPRSAIDYREALVRADAGDFEAQFELGLMHRRGDGIPQSRSEALKWYSLAASSDHAGALNNLALMISNGDGVSRDQKKAAELFTKAADLGSEVAMYNLALHYFEGSGVKRSIKKSQSYMRKAAESGYASAQFKLGCHYYEGEHLRQNFKLALKWLRKAAEQDHEDAHFYLGMMYKDGEGVETSFARAIEHFEQSAQNNAENCELLSTFYENGELGPVDLIAARNWRSHAQELTETNDSKRSENVSGHIPGRKSRKVRLNEKRSSSTKVSRAKNLGVGISPTGHAEDTDEDPKVAWLRNEYEFLQRKLKSGRLLDDYEKGLVAQYEDSIAK